MREIKNNSGGRAKDFKSLPSPKNNPVKRPAVFLDRDGTLNEEMGYINHLSRFRLLPEAAPAIRRLHEAACTRRTPAVPAGSPSQACSSRPPRSWVWI
jgi:hypothetical protein